MSFGFCSPFQDRLKELYKLKGIDITLRGWSLTVAKELISEGIIEVSQNNDEKYKQQNDISRQLRNHLEEKYKNRTPETIWLKRYQEYFSCSFDFLFGLIDAPTHDEKTVKDIIGLDVEATEILKEKLKRDRTHKYQHSQILSALIKHSNFSSFLALLASHPDGSFDRTSIDGVDLSNLEKQAVINSELKDIVINIANDIRKNIQYNPNAILYNLVFGLYDEGKLNEAQLNYHLEKMGNGDFSEIV